MKGTKVKSSKGITLVALVITIIILLILAVVAITAVNGDGIIGKAKEAGRSYNEKAGEENTELARQLGLIESALGGKSENGGWTDNGNGTFTKGSVTVAIGDYVNYNEGTGTPYTPDIEKGAGTSYTDSLQTSEVSTEDLNWRVLGVDENGRLELISADPTQAQLTLYGIEGYKNAETILNEMCNSLYKNEAIAEKARSLNVEDVVKLSGLYDPAQDMMMSMQGNPYGKTYKYGYSTTDSCIKGKEATSETDTSLEGINDAEGGWTNFNTWMGEKITTLETPEWTLNSSSTTAKTLKFDAWFFYTIQDSASVIKNKSDNTIAPNYWLASRCVTATTNNAYFYVRNVSSGTVYNSNLYNSDDGANNRSWAVRPVVSLKSDIPITLCTGENSITNMHKIQ